MDNAILNIYRIIDILKQEFTAGEIFLNSLFIALLIIISLIIYWDNINIRVSKTSRCKRQMDIFNKNKGMFVIEAKDKSRQPLYKITYDTNQNNTNIECSCENGKFINYFNNIPVKNLRTNKDVKVNKTCTCDKYYNVGTINENIIYDGEPGILRYMNTNSSDFFDSLIYSPYT